MANDSHVGERHIIESLGERAHAGNEDFASEKIHIGMRLRDGGGRLAHSATNFQHERRMTAEGLVGVEKLGGVFDLVLRK